MKIQKLIAALMLSGMSAFVLAASTPVKITPGDLVKGETGEEGRRYTVSCSDGKEYPLMSWVERKTWCVNNNVSSEECWKKQIRAAQEACKGGG